MKFEKHPSIPSIMKGEDVQKSRSRLADLLKICEKYFGKPAESVKWMQEEGEAVPTPLGLKKFKGHITLRLPPERHRELAIRCAEERVSLNRFILSRLSA